MCTGPAAGEFGSHGPAQGFDLPWPVLTVLGRGRGRTAGSPSSGLCADPVPAFFSHQCTVQVKLELGHRAQLRKKPTTEGFTHDWMVFVRGPEQCEIQHFVEKVVFRLHDSFPKPKRGECPVLPVGQPSRAEHLRHYPFDTHFLPRGPML